MLRLNRDTAAAFARSHGGWAATAEALELMHSWLPDTAAGAWATANPERQWPSADVTWWEPPSPVALDAETCDEAISQAEWSEAAAPAHPTWQAPWRCTTYDLDSDATGDDEDLRSLGGRALAAGFIANAAWWRLDVEWWSLQVKRYEPGQKHPRHQDLHVGQLDRKLGISIQLSDPDDYDGGELRVHSTVGSKVPVLDAPRTRGSATVFPGWVDHEIAPVTRGVRWALVAWGFGPPIR